MLALRRSLRPRPLCLETMGSAMDWKYAWLDLAVLAVAALAFYNGYKRGLLNQVVWLGSFVVAYVVASRFCVRIAERSGIELHSEEVSVALVFVALFLGIIFVLHILARTISRVVQPTVVGLANSILGGVFTSLIAVVLMLVALNLALILLPELQDTMDDTWIVGRGADLINQLMDRNPLDGLAERFDARVSDFFGSRPEATQP